MSKLFSKRGNGRLWSSSLRETYGEIDLRRETRDLLHGTSSKPPHGHYIVYRRYDLEHTSSFWDEVYRTGVGGPAYEYTDAVVLTRRDPAYSARLAEPNLDPGIITTGLYKYYFEHEIIPSTQDQLFEIDWSDHSVVPTLSKIPTPYAEKFNIKEVFAHKSDSGRTEFWSVLACTDKISY